MKSGTEINKKGAYIHGKTNMSVDKNKAQYNSADGSHGFIGKKGLNITGKDGKKLTIKKGTVQIAGGSIINLNTLHHFQ